MASILKLSIEKGPRSGETLDFPPTTTVRIGRVVRGNNLPIKDPGISSKHLTIEFNSDSLKWVLKDLDSSNGTMLNTLRLKPFTPYELRDGDEVKIGELTSIRVGLVENGPELGPHRNPRSRKGGVETLEANPDLEEVGKGAEIGRRRNPRGQAATKTLEVNPSLEEVAKGVESGVNLGKGNGKGRGRGRTKKEAEDNPNFRVEGNVEDVEEKKVNVGTRRTRNSRKDNEEFLSLADPIPVRRTRNAKNAEKLQKNENLDVGSCKEVENVRVVETKKGRGGGKKKKGEVDCGDNDPQDAILEQPENVDAGEQPCREELMSDVVRQFAMVDVAMAEQLMEEEAIVVASRDEQETCQRLESDDVVLGEGRVEEAEMGKVSDEEELGIDDDDGEEKESDEFPDLEKMTLGEWFDFMEVHLAKQIRAEADEVIEGLRKQAKQYEEIVSEHMNKEGKSPVAN